METTNQKGKIRLKKPHRPKPEDERGMPQHRHCHPLKHRENGTQCTMKSSKKTLREFSQQFNHK
jgi:hypothetical protein